MELKCFVVSENERTKISGRKGKNTFLFLTTEAESGAIQEMIESTGRYHINEAWPLGSDRSHLCALKFSLYYVEALAISSEVKCDLPDVSELLVDAHLCGTRITDVDSVLLKMIPRLSNDPEELLRVFAKHNTRQGWRIRFYRALKNSLEPTVALLLFLLMSPLFLFVAFLVKLTSPGTILYRQTRVGLDGKPFEILKFRSMCQDAEANGPVWASAAKRDSRLTPIGGFLRATHLDELPQLVNVIRGELSFIGPRPERPHFVEDLEKRIPLFRLRTLIKPGVTGWAQIQGGYANSVADSELKLELDLYYVLKHSPWLDLKVVIGTLWILFCGGSEGRKRMNVVSLPRNEKQVSPALPGLTLQQPQAKAYSNPSEAVF